MEYAIVDKSIQVIEDPRRNKGIFHYHTRTSETWEDTLEHIVHPTHSNLTRTLSKCSGSTSLSSWRVLQYRSSVCVCVREREREWEREEERERERVQETDGGSGCECHSVCVCTHVGGCDREYPDLQHTHALTHTHTHQRYYNRTWRFTGFIVSICDQVFQSLSYDGLKSSQVHHTYSVLCVDNFWYHIGLARLTSCRNIGVVTVPVTTLGTPWSLMCYTLTEYDFHHLFHQIDFVFRGFNPQFIKR